jgi:hypothetical protein
MESIVVSADGTVIAGTSGFNSQVAPQTAWIITGIPVPCEADCNQDGVLNLGDFGCFQTRFATGDIYADCNDDGVRNLADFGCFMTRFALGCP